MWVAILGGGIQPNGLGTAVVGDTPLNSALPPLRILPFLRSRPVVGAVLVVLVTGRWGLTPVATRGIQGEF